MALQCPVCTYATPDDVSEAVGIAYLNAHATTHLPGANATPAVANRTPRPPGPKLDRPKVDVGVSLEERLHTSLGRIRPRIGFGTRCMQLSAVPMCW